MKKNKYKSLTHPLILQGICHRGLHNSNDSENGIKAFKNALNAKMAIELDVHLTKDNELVVFHDSSTLRMTSKEGIIEDLTLEEIMAQIKAKSIELKDITYANFNSLIYNN